MYIAKELPALKQSAMCMYYYEMKHELWDTSSEKKNKILKVTFN